MKPRLLVLTPGFPINEADSATVPHIQDWLIEAQFFFEIKIITFQHPFEEKTYQWQGVETYSAGGKNKAFPHRFWTWRKVWKKINTWHSIASFDVVLCFWLTEAALLGEYFCKKNPNVKLFRWALGQDMKADNLYLQVLNLKRGKTLCLSRRFTQVIADFTDELPFGLPSFALKMNTLTERKIDIIGIGSHISLKRYDIFLQTIAILKQDFPTISCVLVGNGKETPTLHALCKQLDLAENVTFIPFLPRPKVFEILAESKILFHTSEYEGQGMVMTEALQMGCYVVCGEVGYVPQTPKTFICPASFFSNRLKAILSQEKQDFEPINMPTMRETVERFFAYFKD